MKNRQLYFGYITILETAANSTWNKEFCNAHGITTNKDIVLSFILGYIGKPRIKLLFYDQCLGVNMDTKIMLSFSEPN